MFISFLLSFAWASAADWDLCSLTKCNSVQQTIQDQFKNNAQYTVPKNTIGRYTGSCWQKNSSESVDPQEEYFSLFHFYPKKDGAMFSRGVYLFGPTTNPYLEMSFEEAEADLNLTAPNFNPLQLQSDLALFQHSYPQSKHFIWYRTSQNGKELYLVAYSLYTEFDLWEMNWCRLKKISK